MANLTKVFADASIDAQSLDEFINADSLSMVDRRLATPVRPLSYYVEYMDSLTVEFNDTISDINSALSNINGT